MTYVLHSLVSEAAQAEPAKEAVRCRGRSLTYGELEAASNGIARALIDGGVARGDRVGIFMPKSVEMVASVYGIMKAGACYVPLDPRAPVSRGALVAADCTIAALVTTPGRAAAIASAMPGHIPRVAVLVDDGSGPAELPYPAVSYSEATADRGASDPGVPAIEMDLAYILYTSGSTGMPKGVMLTHRNALAFVDWCAAKIGIGPDDRLSNHAPLHFDLSVLDLYGAALGRASVSLVPEEEAYFGSALGKFINEERITVWYSVPSALTLLTRFVSEPGSLPTLRAVVFAGEVYPTRQLRELRRIVPHASLWNIYGPTETNVVTYYRVDEVPEDDRAIPIGRACENTEVFAVKEDGVVAGVGEVGELYVRGPTVMKGYWNRPDKTAEMLVQNPVRSNAPDLVYRTGDLVRLRPDGDYDFLGRRDHQIKSRGYRIELGEIDAALSLHPALAEWVTIAVPHEEWGTAIVSCVVPKDGESITEHEVRRHVANRLPRSMVPARVEILRTLPRTSTGKIDRQTLARGRETLGLNR
jgi:amino acid adenylation domain-containing protein